MDKNAGWIKLPENIIDALIQWKFNWWRLYENENPLKAVATTMLLDDQEAKELFENTPMDGIYHGYGDMLESDDVIEAPRIRAKRVLGQSKLYLQR
ncbi:MAG: hypothetical protein M0R47_01165 [Methylobacter sp.]|uniref:hypothetical protein n=1 Tax=Methylobacter sp. TaxID=2051955 RepID=UPI0025E8E8AB|nr:hypothetical protein [Methylobacter sp.]MCK9619124.1 hypothetical protein [Methylobacter sp.]